MAYIEKYLTKNGRPLSKNGKKLMKPFNTVMTYYYEDYVHVAVEPMTFYYTDYVPGPAVAPISYYYEDVLSGSVSKLFLLDAGEACVIDGLAYEYVDQRLGEYDVTFDTDDEVNITGITYSIADLQSKTVYTPGERAVAVYVNGNPYNPLHDSFNVWSAMLTVPEDGVLRIWSSSSYFGYRVNGGSEVAIPGFAEAAAVPINVSQGDVIEYISHDYVGAVVYYNLLPF